MTKILIADDEKEFVDLLCRRLESAGFSTLTAYEGVRALESAHKDHPDLIILDWKMPAGKGNVVMENLSEKSDTKRIPVIVITALGDPNIEREAMRLGAKAFLRKPYDPHTLLQKIYEVLQQDKLEKSFG